LFSPAAAAAAPCFSSCSRPQKKLPLALNRQVICIDNFFTGSKENVAHLLPKSNFELVRHDVVEKILLEVDQVRPKEA